MAHAMTTKATFRYWLKPALLGLCTLLLAVPLSGHASCASGGAKVLWHWPAQGATVRSGGVAMMLVPFGGMKTSAEVGGVALKPIATELTLLRRFRLPDLPVGATATVVFRVEEKPQGRSLGKVEVEVGFVSGANATTPLPQLAAPTVTSCQVPSLNTMKASSCIQNLNFQACLDTGMSLYQWQAVAPVGAVAWLVTIGPAPSMDERAFILPISCDPAITVGGGPGWPPKLPCLHLYGLDADGNWGAPREYCAPLMTCMPWQHCWGDAGANASLSCDEKDGGGSADSLGGATVTDAAGGVDGGPPPSRSPSDDGCTASKARRTAGGPWLLLCLLALAAIGWRRSREA